MVKITLLKGKCGRRNEDNCIKGGEKEISGKCIGCYYFLIIEPKIKIMDVNLK